MRRSYARAGYWKSAEILVCARRKIQSQDGMVILVIGPDFALHVGVVRHHHRFPGVILLQLLRERKLLKFLGLSVEFRDASLIHQRKPNIFILVKMKLERTGWESRLHQRDRIFRRLAGFWV